MQLVYPLSTEPGAGRWLPGERRGASGSGELAVLVVCLFLPFYRPILIFR